MVSVINCDKCNGPYPRKVGQHYLCRNCEYREWAEANPVPLPQSKKALKDLASIGYGPAIKHLESKDGKSKTR